MPAMPRDVFADTSNSAADLKDNVARQDAEVIEKELGVRFPASCQLHFVIRRCDAFARLRLVSRGGSPASFVIAPHVVRPNSNQLRIQSSFIAVGRNKTGGTFVPPANLFLTAVRLERNPHAELYFPAGIEILVGLDGRFAAYTGIGIALGGAVQCHRLRGAEGAKPLIWPQ